MKNLKQLGEFGLIKHISSKLNTYSKRVKKGIGDDCAVFSTLSNTSQLISTDALIESIHFDLKTITPKQSWGGYKYPFLLSSLLSFQG